MNKGGVLMLLGFLIFCVSIYIEGVDVIHRISLTVPSFAIFLVGVVLENYEELKRQRRTL